MTSDKCVLSPNFFVTWSNCEKINRKTIYLKEIYIELKNL